MRSIRHKFMRNMRRCTCCGKRVLMLGYATRSSLTDVMDRDTICFECAFWRNIIDNPPDHMEVVGGKCLRIYPAADKKDKSNILGGKGKMRWFVRPDLSHFHSNDVWLVGEVPQRFLPQLPDTASEITRTTYAKLTRNPKQCLARPCLDRYHCLRFNMELEKEYGPYNAVPANWVAGGEHCASFINKPDAYISHSAKTIH